MKPISIRRWLLAGVLGTTVAVGCRSMEPDLSLATPPLPDAPAPEVSKAPDLSATDEKEAVAKDKPSSIDKADAKTEPEAKTAEAASSLSIPPADLLPSLEEVRKTLPEATPAAEAKPKPGPDKLSLPPAQGETEAPASARSRPNYSHAEDYSELCGQLEHFGRTCRLRYASLDEVDPYGGSVTLLEDARLATVQEGQNVRVRGHLVDREAHVSGPPYRIDSILPLDK